MAQVQSDFYHVLGVTEKASLKEIKAAYRHLVRQYHPDVNAGAQAKERFLKIQEAYRILGVLDKKMKYDQWLKSSRTNRAKSASTKPSSTPEGKTSVKDKPLRSASSPSPTEAKAESATTVMDHVMSIFKGQKEEAASANAPYKTGVKPTSTIQRYEATLVILKQELAEGRVFRLPAKTHKPCQYCSSTGRINARVCLICHGKKVQSVTEEIDLRLPVEIANTGLYTLSCLKPAQSLVSLSLQIIPFVKGMTRRGLDIYYVFDLSVPDWMLGGIFNMPGLREDETLNVTIPPCMAVEKFLRLQGKGLRMKSQQGDYFIQVRLQLPTGLTSAERALYQELKALS